MSALLKKPWWKKPRYTRIVFVFLVLLCILMAMSVFNRFTIERDMAARRATVEAELSELKDRQATLEAKVEYLREERGVEAEIRKHFDVAKEGEQVVVLLEDERQESDESSTVATEDERQSWWRSLLPW
ncbi:MAG: septum formation initiator family protein [Candidatus Paceibacterota bacterium]